MTPKTKDEFLREAIAARLLGDAACGVGDPYPFDVESHAKLEAFYALGGTEEEAQAAWQDAFARSTRGHGQRNAA